MKFFIAAAAILHSLLFLVINANAQPKIATAGWKIAHVKFVGSDAISNIDLLEYFKPLNFSSKDTARIKAGISSIQEKYFSEGYLLFKVDSSSLSADTASPTLTIYLSEGPRLTIGKLLITGNKFFTFADLTTEFATRVGSPLNQDDLEKDIDYIIGKYNNSGFPLTKVHIDSIFVYGGDGTDSLGVALSVNEGERFRINAVRVEGNTETKDYVVLRAMRILPGAYYDQSEMANAKQRLQKLGFFQSVSDPELFEAGDTTGVLVKVVEGNTNTFDGVIGYMPAQLGQSGYFTGMIDISMLNLFGSGRKFRAMWHQETKLTQELEIGYAEPYIFGYPINAEFDFAQRQQDTTSVTRNFGVSGTFLFNDNFNGSTSISTLSTTPLQNSNNNYFVYESSVLNLGVGITFDTRDDIYSPRQGVLYLTQIQFGEKKIYGPQQLITPTTKLINYTEHLGIDLSLYHEFIARQIFAIGIHGEQVTGTELDQSDMYRLGGTNTIRGYIENQFIATKAAWTNIEYRFATGRESFFFGFLDAGYIYRQSDPIANVPANSLSAYGYGAGAQVETGIGILKASYALGKGDSFVEGKIHFGIVNRF
ncbi:MAG TPA: POTRA domain-containing protein [Candidatus Acidoferrales bacterium]|nr:POTRA domain-containing protein [Candidatus Acidoferrales bacterium]